MISILIADDHPLMREGLKHLIGGQSDMSVVGEVENGPAALAAVAALSPDVLLLDLSLPVMSGIEVAERVRSIKEKCKILVLTVHEEPVYVTQLLRAKVAGYLLKRSAATSVVPAIRSVVAGDVFIDPALAGMLAAVYASGLEDREGQSSALSGREREIVTKTAQGFSNKEIAADLEISVKTVETYKARILEKIGLRTRVDMVRFATSRGWLSD